MWGMEATVMLPLQSGCAIHSGSPLLPADIAACLAEFESPRWLVTTPLHIRNCVLGSVALPALAGVATATAPLDAGLAARFEAQCGAPVIEIYGSTETGAIATRRTAEGADFRLLNGLRLQARPAEAIVDRGHVGLPIILNDRIEVRGERSFALLGRGEDIVKVGGKRTTIAALNAELGRLPGVVDGTFWRRDDSAVDGRLAAFVVAPGLARIDIVAALRERIDPVFLPRPLLLVDALPRTTLGKLPQREMRQFANAALARGSGSGTSSDSARWQQVSGSHPALAGHFPGAPIVPGAWLLTLVEEECARQFGDAWVGSITQARFRKVITPEMRFRVEVKRDAAAALSFSIDDEDGRLADGRITLGSAR
jgi:acyl-coenzyme A synthetase/AMP-(fatty) acid ligase